MAYEKTEWKNGDTITAEKLNHMEDGIAEGGGRMVVTASPESSESTTFVLDKTWQEINDAFINGTSIIVELILDSDRILRYAIIGVEFDETQEIRRCAVIVAPSTIYTCANRNNYPHS